MTEEEPFRLMVNKQKIPCSRQVIASSGLFTDIIKFSEDEEDESPIVMPGWISKQIILDYIEMVDKGDFECAHLGKLIDEIFDIH